MKKTTPMPLSGGTYRVDDGVLSRDDDAPTAAPASPSTEKPLRRSEKPQQSAGTPARKR